MSADRTPFTVDGIDYTLERHWGGDVFWVYDCNGALVADGEKDTAAEQLFCKHIDLETGEGTSVEAGRDLYDEPDLMKIAQWLMAVEV